MRSLAFLLAPFGAVGLVVSCSSQEASPAFDAGLERCDPGPFLFCPEATEEAGTQGVCPANDPRYPRYLSRLPRAPQYPVGCVVNFVGDRDEKGNCRVDAVCKCVVSEVTSVLDGGPDASGSTVTTRTEPAWNCAP